MCRACCRGSAVRGATPAGRKWDEEGRAVAVMFCIAEFEFAADTRQTVVEKAVCFWPWFAAESWR